MLVQTQARLAQLGFQPNGHGFDAEVARLRRAAPKIQLSPEYWDFLRQHGGGCFDPQVFVDCIESPPVSGGRASMFLSFLGFSGAYPRLTDCWKESDERFASGLVPFADVDGGDFYCFAADGTVTYWDHDSANVYRAAASFTDFVERMVQEE